MSTAKEKGLRRAGPKTGSTGDFLLQPKSGARERRVADLAGMLRRPGRKSVSIKAMTESIAIAAKARRGRGQS